MHRRIVRQVGDDMRVRVHARVVSQLGEEVRAYRDGFLRLHPDAYVMLNRRYTLEAVASGIAKACAERIYDVACHALLGVGVCRRRCDLTRATRGSVCRPFRRATPATAGGRPCGRRARRRPARPPNTEGRRPLHAPGHREALAATERAERRRWREDPLEGDVVGPYGHHLLVMIRSSRL